MCSIPYHNGKQLVCCCQAYDFPHRFGGGRCNGYHLVLQSNMCMNCHGANCDVRNETEHPRECPYVQNFCEYYEVKI